MKLCACKGAGRTRVENAWVCDECGEQVRDPRDALLAGIGRSVGQIHRTVCRDEGWKSLPDPAGPLERAVAEALIGAVESSSELRARFMAALGLDAGQPESGPAVFTTATLAAEMGLQPDTIRRAIRCGDLAATRRGKGYVISRAAVAEWAEGDSRATSSAPTSVRRRPARRGRPLRAALDEMGRSG